MRSTFSLLIRAYKGLKSLLDPAMEGNPYILESGRTQKPFISLNPVTPGSHLKHSGYPDTRGYGVKRMSWR